MVNEPPVFEPLYVHVGFALFARAYAYEFAVRSFFDFSAVFSEQNTKFFLHLHDDSAFSCVQKLLQAAS